MLVKTVPWNASLVLAMCLGCTQSAEESEVMSNLGEHNDPCSDDDDCASGYCNSVQHICEPANFCQFLGQLIDGYGYCTGTTYVDVDYSFCNNDPHCGQGCCPGTGSGCTYEGPDGWGGGSCQRNRCEDNAAACM